MNRQKAVQRSAILRMSAFAACGHGPARAVPLLKLAQQGDGMHELASAPSLPCTDCAPNAAKAAQALSGGEGGRTAPRWGKSRR
jgi:hypothetical protein